MNHHELGASGAHRWIRCPGSVALCRGAADLDTEYAREGTAAHELGYLSLSQGVDPLAADGVIVEGSPYPVDDEMAQAVAAYVEAVRSPHFIRTVFGLLPEADPVLEAEHVELRVDLSRWLPGVSSTLDHCGVWRVGADYFAVVTDFKYGAGEYVSALGNEQIRIYLGGFLDETEWQHSYTAMAGVIFQPRRFGPSWEVVTECQVRQFMSELTAYAAATQEPDAPVVPGHKQCRWCDVKGSCKARTAWLLQTMRIGPSELAPMTAELLRPEEIAAMVPYLKEYRDLLNAISNEGLRLAMEGRLPGYKAVEGRSNRTWGDEEYVRAALAGAGLPLEEFTISKLASPAQAEKKLGKRGFAELLEPLVVKPPGSPQLAPITDPRPEYGANLFED